MKKLDSEKFRAVLEAITTEKTNRRKGTAAQPRVAQKSEMPAPPADFEMPSERRRLDS